MISRDARARLSAKARLRLDKQTGQHVLLAPERGLALNATGTAILQRCDGQATVAEIAASLAAAYTQDVAVIEREVSTFLQALVERGLVEVTP